MRIEEVTIEDRSAIGIQLDTKLKGKIWTLLKKAWPKLRDKIIDAIIDAAIDLLKSKKQEEEKSGENPA